jgi:phage I-like protein
MKRQIAFAALALEIPQDGGMIQITPAGEFRARDGRPTECKHWFIDAAIASRVIARVSARKTRSVIDYEHQTFKTEQNGSRAPAAGWFTGADLVWQNDGLFIRNPEWTDTARAHIAAREYLYLSPVLAYDARTGEILDVINVALTNFPAIDGMNEITLAAARALLTADYSTPTEEPKMDEILTLLIKLLGLPDDATTEDVLAALQAIEKEMNQQQPAQGTAAAKNLMALLTANKTTIENLNTALTALKAKSDNVDPSRYVPVTAVTKLQEQVAELTGRINGGEVESIITAALTAGQLLPALEPWARELGQKDIASLKIFISKAPAVAALTGQQTGGRQPEGADNHGLTAEEIHVAKLSGLTPKEFAEAKTLMSGNE